MNKMRTTIRRLGNSQGVTIPRDVLDAAGLGINSAIDMTVDGSTIVLRKASATPREGWAEAAASIADEPVDQDWLDADIHSGSHRDAVW